MASLADVENALVCAIAQSVYPDGTAEPSAIGTPAKIYRGWPVPGNLDADLRAGVANISVFPIDQERNVTRYPRDWQELPQPQAYLTLDVGGDTVTVGGQITCPLNAAITAGAVTYVYPLQATDTPTSVATALSALIGTGSSSSGPVITVPGETISTAIGAVGGLLQELRRQIKSFRISLWCPGPAIRGALSALVDVALATPAYLNLPDGSSGRILYVNSHTDDVPEKALLFRQDFVYSVEYATTNVTTAAEIISSTANVNQPEGT